MKGKADIMKEEAFWTIMLTLLFNGVLTSAFNVQMVRATRTTYIRADGSVDPSTAPILNIGNVSYTFTDNINDSIIVERDNIVIDGAGYTLQGLGNETGINITGRSNVTVKNTKVTKFYYGIYLYGSSNNTLSDNTASNNTYGIMLDGSTGNTLVGNNASNNDWDGIYLVYSDSNTLYGNTISNNNRYGTMFSQSPNNRIFHNNFINNAMNQTYLYQSFNNLWDNDYPYGGNYWSDYNGTDLFSGPYQNVTGNDGIGDTGYVIDADNTDGYPLMIFWDVNPPLTMDNYDGLWHTADLTVNLAAVDDLGDVAETYYKINDNPTQNLTTHGQPRITTEGANNTLEYWSLDNAGNEELPHKTLTRIKIDKTYPTIETPSRTPEGDVLPDQPVKVSVNVTDATSGLENVTLHYTINNGTTWEEPKPMNYSTSTSLYEVTIRAQPAETWVRFKIVVYDYAGNNATKDGTEPYCIYQVIPEFPSAIILLLFMILSIVVVAVAKKRFPRKFEKMSQN